MTSVVIIKIVINVGEGEGRNVSKQKLILKKREKNEK